MKDQRMTIADVCALTGATPMTIYNWRNKRTNKTKLTCNVKRAGSRSRVSFTPKTLSAWLKRNDVPIADKKVARQFGISIE